MTERQKDYLTGLVMGFLLGIVIMGTIMFRLVP